MQGHIWLKIASNGLAQRNSEIVTWPQRCSIEKRKTLEQRRVGCFLIGWRGVNVCTLYVWMRRKQTAQRWGLSRLSNESSRFSNELSRFSYELSPMNCHGSAMSCHGSALTELKKNGTSWNGNWKAGAWTPVCLRLAEGQDITANSWVSRLSSTKSQSADVAIRTFQWKLKC